MELVFLSEYTNLTRTAQVYLVRSDQTYQVICYCAEHKISLGPFLSESSAENAAEDWVLKS